MSGDKATISPPDCERIGLVQEQEVRDWSQKLGVTEEELRFAVQTVGNKASTVREYFRSRKVPGDS